MKKEKVRPVIDKEETLEAVRDKYRSILRFCKAHECSSVAFYHAVTGARGGKGRRAPETDRILGILQEDGVLIVASAEDAGQASNG